VRVAHGDDGLIGRWPRRFAALVCLGFALVAATHQPTVRGADGSRSPGVSPGERTVPVSVSVDPRTYLHVRDVVELLAAPDAEPVTGSPPQPAAVVAARAIVVSIGQPNAGVGDASWPLVVSVDEQSARQIATLGARQVLAVLASGP
jgi:hypothetical protein